jgi:hypothetical protein
MVMAGFFDFLQTGRYDARQISRLNMRYRHIVEPLKAEIAGAEVLDLGSHDGRWPYAIAAAGARSVLGIEGRAALIKEFGNFPDTPYKGRVNLVEGDFVQKMDELVAQGKKFDLIFCLGVYYHTMHHYRMIVQMAAFRPRAIVIDSVLSTSPDRIIRLARNRTDENLNALAEAEGQSWVPVGLPSQSAIEFMAESVGYQAKVVPWKLTPEERRGAGIADYFRAGQKRRYTLVLRPSR